MLQRSMRGWWLGAGFGLALAACGTANAPPAGGPGAAETDGGGGGHNNNNNDGGGGGATQPRLAMTTVGSGGADDPGTLAHWISPGTAPNAPPWGLLCKYAIPLTPGETLQGQNTAPGGEPNAVCRPSDAPQHFYGFDLPPGMRATITVTPSTQFTAVVRVMVTCDATECITDQQSPLPGEPAVAVVDSPGDQTVSKIVTVSGLDAGDNGGYAIGLTLTPLGDTGGGDGGMTGGDGGMTASAAAPRQIAPLSTATVTSQRPTLRWALADGTQGARVEICADRACSTVEQSFDAAGSSGAPASDLAPGVHFWRLHGTDASGAGSATSPVWSFYVGHRTAGDSSWGVTPDYNGDGAPDLATIRHSTLSGALSTGIAVFSNTGSGLPAMPSYSFDVVEPSSSDAVAALAAAGDLDGDGFGDLAYSVRVGAAGDVRNDVVVLYGGPGSLVGARSTRIPASTVLFGRVVSAAGDVNGDGYGDLLIDAAGRAAVYFGGPSGVATTPGATLQFTLTGSNWGSLRMAPAGDVNGDGYGDVVVAYEHDDGFLSAVFVHLGDPSATTLPAIRLGTTYGSYPGLAAADVNGDGFADVGVASRTEPVQFDVYYGGPAGIATTASVSLPFSGSGPPDATALPGDFDGDGYGDFAFYHHDMGMHVRVLHGGPGGLSALNDLSFEYPANTYVPRVLLSVGDANVDGYADLLTYGDDDATVPTTDLMQLFLGGPSGVDATVDGTLTWPNNTYSPSGWTYFDDFAIVR